MPGRPRLYSDAAERQREYRARQQERTQRAQESAARLRASAQELYAALEAAAVAGEPTARTALHLGLNETLLQLAAHYRHQAAVLAAAVQNPSAPARRKEGHR